MQYLVVVAVIAIVYFFFIKKRPLKQNSSNNNEKKTEKKKKPQSNDMIECSACGIYSEVSDSILSNGKYYCSNECLERA